MRQSGRTAKLLLRLGTYISEHWDEKRNVLFTSHNFQYSLSMLNHLAAIIQPTGRVSMNTFIYGKVRVVIFTWEDYIKGEKTRGIKWDYTFIDHHADGRS